MRELFDNTPPFDKLINLYNMYFTAGSLLLVIIRELFKGFLQFKTSLRSGLNEK